MTSIVQVAFEAELEKIATGQEMAAHALLLGGAGAVLAGKDRRAHGATIGTGSALGAEAGMAVARAAERKSLMLKYLGLVTGAILGGEAGAAAAEATLGKAGPQAPESLHLSIRSRDSEKTAAARTPGLEKIAAIWGCALSSSMPCGPDLGKKWSDRFRDTPFHKAALSLEKSEADKQVGFAQEAVVSAERQMREAQFRVRVATLEAKLLNWKAEEGGESARTEMKEKLACCSPCSYGSTSGWEWSDHFKVSPFYKEAVALDAEDAHMNVERAKRSVEDSKRWRGDDEDRIARAELEAEYADYRVKSLS